MARKDTISFRADSLHETSGTSPAPHSLWLVSTPCLGGTTDHPFVIAVEWGMKLTISTSPFRPITISSCPILAAWYSRRGRLRKLASLLDWWNDGVDRPWYKRDCPRAFLRHVFP